MARITNGINGAFSGRVATVVGYTRYGQTYMRGVPKKITKPPSEKQILNRKAMALSRHGLPTLSLVSGLVFRTIRAASTGLETRYHISN